jgi:pectate lyase
MKSKRLCILFLLCTIALPEGSCLAGVSEGDRYLKAVRDFADTVIEKGRDTYGDKDTPLFVDGLHAQSLRPVIWKKDGQSWVLSNFASQQPLIRILDGLTTLTKDPEYRRAAADATGYVLRNLQSDNGLIYWGGHLAWDLETVRVVGQFAGSHDM